MRTIIAVLFSSACALGAHATRVAGVVTGMDAGTLQPLPFVSVVVKGTTNGTMTDMEGRFSLEVPPGACVLQWSYVGFETTERPIEVADGAAMTIDIELKPQSNVLTTVNVTAERRVDSEVAVMMDVRRSEQVVSGMGRQQIARSQDRTAGDVVKRIPGVTLIGERFIMVRGLADRYNTVLLNGAAAPSLEADKRAFSFDMLPSGALDRVMIHKSGSPELPGDLAGGTIKVATLGVPDKNETRLNWAISSRVGTTFGSVMATEGSPTDALGSDNGQRALPGSFPASLDQVDDADRLATLGRALPNTWSLSERTAMPDQRAGLFLARRFGKEDGIRFGTVNSIDHANTTAAWQVRNYSYNAYFAEAGRHDTIYNYLDKEYQRTYRTSVLSNWSAAIGHGTTIEFRNLFNQQGEARNTVRTGRDLGESGDEVRNLAMRWQQRSIYSGQLLGRHENRAGNTRYEWVLGYNRSTSKEPDYRRVRTTRPVAAADDNEPFRIQIASGASVIDAGRFYSDLVESAYTARFDAVRDVEGDSGRTALSVRGGFYAERKDRAFSARWMSFVRSNFMQFDEALLELDPAQAFADANINTTTGFKLAEGTNPSDRYDAASQLTAAYVSASLPLCGRFNLSGGVRLENNLQTLTSGTYTNGKVNVERNDLDVLPSINATWNLSERTLIRIAGSSTVNRPEFRELAPFNYYDFSTNTTLAGNPDLQRARILNADARWEHYPSPNEMISGGVFYKRFTDPIEMFFVSVTGSGGARNFSYGNAQAATVMGAEVEVKRSFSALSTAAIFQRTGLVLNGALIQSEVELGEEVIQKSRRPLVGQSPYIANAGLYYENKGTRTQLNVLWNVFGRRLYAAGSAVTPDLYEMPRHSVDITFTKGIGERVDLKLGVQDLLNQRTLLVQDANDDGTIGLDDEEVMSFRRGSYIIAGVSVRF